MGEIKNTADVIPFPGPRVQEQFTQIVSPASEDDLIMHRLLFAQSDSEVRDIYDDINPNRD